MYSRSHDRSLNMILDSNTQCILCTYIITYTYTYTYTYTAFSHPTR